MEISHKITTTDNTTKIQFTLDGVVYDSVSWADNLKETMTKLHSINFEEEMCNCIVSVFISEYTIKNGIGNSNIREAMVSYITKHVLPTLTV